MKVTYHVYQANIKFLENDVEECSWYFQTISQGCSASVESHWPILQAEVRVLFNKLVQKALKQHPAFTTD